MSHTNLIVTLMSDDKPGIVSQVAKTIAEHNGNWLDSHMVQLAGKFTGLLRIDVPDTSMTALSNDLKALSTQGIDTLIEQEKPLAEPLGNIAVHFELSGPDRKGIVSEISKAFSIVGMSIDKMQTHCSSTPWSGEPLFEAKGVLLTSSATPLDALQDNLQQIQDELGLDITLSTPSP